MNKCERVARVGGSDAVPRVGVDRDVLGLVAQHVGEAREGRDERLSERVFDLPLLECRLHAFHPLITSFDPDRIWGMGGVHAQGPVAFRVQRRPTQPATQKQRRAARASCSGLQRASP